MLSRRARLSMGLGFAAFFLGTLALGLSACSPATEPGPAVCSASTCSGCCEGNRCIASPDEEACGSGGSACQACRSNETCIGGECLLSDCDGCVDPLTSECVSGTTNSQCGSLGGACAKCGTDTACQNGVCNSTVCAGCIDGSNGSCKAGNTNSLCGAGGGACEACTGGETCVDRACAAPPACGPATCAGGCCDSNDACQMPGNTSTACGTGGGPCATCGSPATCVDSVCVTPCGPDNAAGCCDAMGKEQVSNTDHCGSAGATCMKCAANELCSSGQCVATSCSGTCLGCCTGTGGAMCDPGTGANAGKCGKNGAACTVCGAGRACSNGTCVVDPASKWKVILVSGILPFKDETDSLWDTIGAYPDAYVWMHLDYGGANTVNRVSLTQDNTLTPNWNNEVLFPNAITPVVTAALLQKTTYVYVRDEDTASYDDMGLCSISLAGAFDGNIWTYTCNLPPSSPMPPSLADRPFKWQLKIRLERIP